MKYRILKDWKGSPDGMKVIQYQAGQEDVVLHPSLVEAAIAEGWVEPITENPDETPGGFEGMKKKELLALAEESGVEIPPGAKKKQIIAALQEAEKQATPDEEAAKGNVTDNGASALL